MNEKQQTVLRIALFVVLTWLVLMITPKFFQGPTTPVTVQPPVDSASSVQPPSGISAAPAGGERPAAATTPVAAPELAATPVESLTVADSLSRYLFTNRAASVIAVELLRYRRLGSDSGTVQLLRDGEPLLRYHLFVAGDTIPLSDLPFSTEVVRRPDGTIERIRYTTVVPGLAPGRATATDPGSEVTAGARLSLEYSFAPNSYLLRVDGRLEGAPAPSYLIVQLPSGLRSGEANPDEDQTHYAVAYKRLRGDVEGISFGKLDPQEKNFSDPNTPISWTAVKSKYFIVGLLKPESDSGFLQVETVGGARFSRSATHVNTFVLDDVSDGTFSFEVYAGPQEFKRLTALGRDFQNSNPYGGFLQPLVQPFAVLVMRALLWLKSATGLSYGWVLVIFGVLVRLLLWPLNQKAMRTTMRMQRIQPELSAIQEKHKGNPQKQQEEIMRVYRDHGMTPFSPLAGCLPMLIPMPVLFALFFVFQNTIEFRGVPFLWLPDISLKDPFYIIPVFMGVSMFVMSWMGSRNTPQNPQTKMMLYMLPVVFTVLFLNFASGLNLYYAVQNIAALPQQWLIARERAKGAAAQPVAEKKKGAGQQKK